MRSDLREGSEGGRSGNVDRRGSREKGIGVKRRRRSRRGEGTIESTGEERIRRIEGWRWRWRGEIVRMGRRRRRRRSRSSTVMMEPKVSIYFPIKYAVFLRHV